jgi:hypothetical protein
MDSFPSPRPSGSVVCPVFPRLCGTYRRLVAGDLAGDEVGVHGVAPGVGADAVHAWGVIGVDLVAITVTPHGGTVAHRLRLLPAALPCRFRTKEEKRGGE